MNRYWKCRMTALMVALAIAGLMACRTGVDERPQSAASATAAAMPKDPCTLLKRAEIQALAPNADIGSGVSDTTGLPMAVGCTYTWGPSDPAWGQTSLSVNVADASQVWPGGLSPADIKERVLVEVRTGGPDASEIPGIGDGAVFTTPPKTHEAMAKAYVVKGKGVLLLVTFHGGNALAQKDKIIALLKAAAARL